MTQPGGVDAIMASIRAAVTAPALPALELTEPLDEPAPAPAQPAAPAPAATPQNTTLEQLARELMAPALTAWLDRHLPELVQREVAAAVERLTAPPRR